MPNERVSLTAPSASKEPIPTQLVGYENVSPQDTQFPADSLAAQLYAKAQGSVGKVTVYRDQSLPSDQRSAVGSAFVLTPDGQMATDYHVVKGAKSITIDLNHQTYSASIVKVDQASDLALLKIDSSSTTFTPLKLASSSQLEANQPIAAYGFPNNSKDLYFSPGHMTERRPLSSIIADLKGGLMPGENANRSLIEAQMKAEGGNSGGPLLNDKGEVVGVVDLSDTTQHADATPVEDLIRLLNDSKAITATSGTTMGSLILGNRPLYSVPFAPSQPGATLGGPDALQALLGASQDVSSVAIDPRLGNFRSLIGSKR